MLHILNLMLLDLRAHQTMTKEKKTMKKVQSYSMTKKWNAKTTFLKAIRRYALKKRRQQS